MKNINWESIGGNLFAVWQFTLAVYPTASPETIWASVQDGSIWFKLAHLFGVWMGYKFGQQNTVVLKYVT